MTSTQATLTTTQSPQASGLHHRGATLYINGEEVYPGDTHLCDDWAREQIKYDYEDGLEFTERDNPNDEYNGDYYDDYTECD